MWFCSPFEPHETGQARAKIAWFFSLFLRLILEAFLTPFGQPLGHQNHPWKRSGGRKANLHFHRQEPQAHPAGSQNASPKCLQKKVRKWHQNNDHRGSQNDLKMAAKKPSKITAFFGCLGAPKTFVLKSWTGPLFWFFIFHFIIHFACFFIFSFFIFSIHITKGFQ